MVKGFTYESLNLYNFFTTIGHQCSKWGLQGWGDKGGKWTELPIVGCGAIGKMSQYFSPLTPTLCGPQEVAGGMIPCCGSRYIDASKANAYFRQEIFLYIEVETKV